jgi:dTDP-4-amino-4,6-dideoxygalactose transaminase
MSMREIPFLDLVTVHRELREELRSVFASALDTAGFVAGPVVQEFERDFAEFCESQFCVGMASGTDALRLALIAAGVQPGDTVVTVPLTFIATTEAISQAGAWPDFVDIDERTYNMDPKRLQDYLETQCTVVRGTGKLVNRKTGRSVTAVVPVHLYGQSADMDTILRLADRYRHHGFWACMDTLKDKQAFDDMNARGDTPWAVWKSAEGRSASSSGCGSSILTATRHVICIGAYCT